MARILAKRQQREGVILRGAPVADGAALALERLAAGRRLRRVRVDLQPGQSTEGRLAQSQRASSDKPPIPRSPARNDA